MILGMRQYHNPKSCGLNIFLLESWSLPIEDLGLIAFNGFDAAISKFQSDKDATVVTSIVSNADEQDLSFRRLETSTRAAILSLPLRFQVQAKLWTAHFENNVLRMNLPRWARLSIESSNGELFHIESKNINNSWSQIALNSNDNIVHLNLFGESVSVENHCNQKIRFVRLTTALEAHKFLVPEGLSFIISPEAKVA